MTKQFRTIVCAEMSSVLTLLEPKQARQYYADDIRQEHTLYPFHREHAESRSDVSGSHDSIRVAKVCAQKGGD